MRCSSKNLWLLLLAFLCLSCTGSAHGNEKSKLYDPTAVYLTWQKQPDSTMTINWITPLDRHEDILEYRKSDEENWVQAVGTHFQLPEKTPYLLHRIELTGLQPGTSYQFRTGSDAITYKFKTMPSTLASPIRFIAGGDMYHDDLETLRVTNIQAAKTSPLFVLVGGDIAYASSKLTDFLPRWIHPWIDRISGQSFDRWLSWLVAWKEDMVTPEGLMIPMLPAIGNHDVIGRYGQTPEQAPFFYSLFPMPGKLGYNVLNFANYMSIFLLDSGHTNPIGGKQVEWLEKSLQQHKDVPHKFALYHVPAYPSVHKMTQDISTQVRKFWVPSFDKFRLTAAFENHEHSYKRSHLLLGDAIAVDGVLYIGDGGWGVKKPRRPRRLGEKWYIASELSARHFLVVDVEQDKQTVRAVNFDGTVFDSFTW
jgi:hypothetical protein